MALFGGTKKHQSIALFDITASSVGAAFSVQATATLPTLIYTCRIPIRPHEGEELSEAMLRTTEEAAKTLISQGAPVLRQLTGSGHVHKIVTSIGAPWEKAQVRVQSLSKQKPFVVTHALLTELSQKGAVIPEGFSVKDETVIATLLNGYDIPNPFGKKAVRADLIVLSSMIQQDISARIEKIVRKEYHTHALLQTAFISIVYSLFRNIFVHEKDFIVLHVSSSSTDLALMKRGLLVDTISNEHGIDELLSLVSQKAHAGQNSSILIDPTRNARFAVSVTDAEKEWLTHLRDTLSALAEHNSLPRTVFLLADPGTRDYLAQIVNSSETRSLWLTDEPLRIVPITQAHLAPFLQVRGEAESDVFLGLLALFSQQQSSTS